MGKAVKVAIIEHKKGFESKVDDYIVCLSEEECKTFKSKFNEESDMYKDSDWYMTIEGEPIHINITDKQLSILEQSEYKFLHEEVLNKF